MSKYSQNCPEQWQMKPLTEVVSLNPNYSSPEQEDYTFIPMDALNTETMEISYYERRNQDKLTNVKFKNDDVLFARITPSTENGKGALIHNLQEPIAYGSTELVVLSPNKEYILPKFLFYITKLPRFRNRATSLMEGATGRQRVPKFFFESQKILLPPLREQKKIVSIIFNIDKSIINSQKLIDYLQLLKKGLMQCLFTEGLGHTEFKETLAGKFPKEWSIDILKNLVQERDGLKRGPWGGSVKKAFFVSSGYKIYEQKCVISNDFSLGNYYIDEIKFQELKQFEIKAGDLLMTAAGTLGVLAIVPKGIKPGIYNQAIIRFRLKENIINKLFFKYLLESDYLYKLIRRFTYGSAIKNFASIKILSSVKFPIPPLDEQDEIVKILQNFDLKFENELEYYKNLKEIKIGLMQEILTGKKRVKIN